MKFITSFSLLFFISPCFGQGITEKKFYTDDYVLTDSLHASHYQIYTYANSSKKAVVVSTFTINGRIMTEVSYSNIDSFVMEGPCRIYYENGQLWRDLRYSNSQLDGKIMVYYENGNIRRIDYFEDGKFLQGNCYTIEGKDTLHFDMEKQPEYPGGIQAIYRFLSDNIVYPKVARRKGIEGSVVMKFTIDNNGDMIDFEIIRSPHQLLTDEALRVAKLLKKWKPGELDGHKIMVRYTLPVKFKLE